MRKLKVLVVSMLLAGMFFGTISDAQASSISYVYDNSNRLIKMYFVNDGVRYVTEFSYDGNGNLISKSTRKLRDIDAPDITSYSNASYEVVAHGIPANASKVEFPSWNKDDQSATWYKGEKVEDGVWKAVIPFKNHKVSTGDMNYWTDIYVDGAYFGGSQTLVKRTTSLRIPAQANLADGGYEVYLDGVGEHVERVEFPSWTEKNGQDDLVWNKGVRVTKGTWKVTIPFSEHKFEQGTYTTHVYTYDRHGNSVGVEAAQVQVSDGVKAPKETSYSNASYEVVAYGVAANATKVEFPSWNPQDTVAIWYQGEKVGEGIWKAIIPFQNHKQGAGDTNYWTDVYVDGVYTGGSQTLVKRTTSLRIPVEADLSDGGYDVYLYGVGEHVAKVEFPTWTEAGGQDDLIWTRGYKVAIGTWKVRIPFSDHNNEKGTYNTHVYTFDRYGNPAGVKSAIVQVNTGIKAPKETSYSNASYEVVVSGIPANAANVEFPSWNPLDSVAVWYQGEKVGEGVWKARIPFQKHKAAADDMNYWTDIYVDGTYYGGSQTLVKRTTSLRIPTSAKLVDGGYEVYLDGVGEHVDKVEFPTWTESNGQDDIVWSRGYKVANGTWKVWIPFSEHHHERGPYTTHVYTFDRYGNLVGVGGSTVIVQ